MPTMEEDQAGSPAPFDRLGPRAPQSPLVVSVPHAGRDYPDTLVAASALPVEALAALEDRHVDALAAGLPAMGITTFVQRRARAWIDLNRDEREIDPAMIAPAPRATGLIASAKVRGGLGLIPRRIAGAGEIMRRRLSASEVAARIASDHRPWHRAIADALAAARARFGVAMLLDLHSMPPLAPVDGHPPARLVFGDRHGVACAPRFVSCLQAVAARHGIVAAHNAPYAGGHTLDRHARPAAAIHAVQIEIDRGLYLLANMRTPGAGMANTIMLVEDMARGLLLELGAVPETALAAE